MANPSTDNQQQEINKPAYYAVIPASVRYCKDLQPGARLLYGELTALANKEGYSWASNKYFSELYDVDDSTIERWLKSLKDNNFIYIESKKTGFTWDRKIWVSIEIKEMFANPQKRGYDASKLGAPTPKNEGYNNTSNNTSKKNNNPQTPKNDQSVKPNESNVVVFSCLKGIGLSDEEQIALSKEYANDEIALKHGVSFASHPETKIKTTLIQAIRWAAKNKPEIPKTSIDKENQHKKIAKALEAKTIMPPGIKFESLSNHAEIVFSPNSLPLTISYTENGFEEQLKNALRKYGARDKTQPINQEMVDKLKNVIKN